MSLRDAFSRIITMRRVVLDLSRIATALETQTQLLARIADHLAPPPVLHSKDDLRETGASSVNYAELGRIQDFADRVRRDLGREPTDEEIVDHLEGREVSL